MAHKEENKTAETEGKQQIKDENNKFKLPEYSVAIPHDFQIRPGDIICICPANEKNWKTIGDMKRTKWGYSYMAPLISKANELVLIMDENTTFDKTIKKIGSAIIVDYSNKLKKMEDGQFEVRYYKSNNGYKYERTLKAISIINGKPYEFKNV